MIVCWVYSSESPRWGDSNEYTQHTISWKTKNISLNICFLELSEEFRKGLKNEFELAMVNEPSVFEPSRFDCIYIWNTTGLKHNIVVAGVGSSLTQSSCISYFSIYTFFWSTCISIDPGPEFFVEVCLNLKLYIKAMLSRLLFLLDQTS